MSSTPMSAAGEQRGYFVHLEPAEMASFVKRDYEILASRFEMHRHFYQGTLHALADRAATYLGTIRSDFTFSWFAYLQAYWAVRYSQRLEKKSVVVLGGFDVCRDEDPQLADRLESVRFILRNADGLFAVSERVRQQALEIVPSAQISLIYQGFDAEKYSIGRKDRIVTTIGYVRQGNLERKGLKVFVDAAARLPKLKFFLVGKWLDDSVEYLRSIASSNVTFTGFLSEVDLLNLLRRTSVYVQASMHEGFGCSLAEAMLCGCVPVVSDRGAIPEVVGDTGTYIDPRNAESVAEGVDEAMTRVATGSLARNRIATLFPLERRRRLLLGAVEKVLE